MALGTWSLDTQNEFKLAGHLGQALGGVDRRPNRVLERRKFCRFSVSGEAEGYFRPFLNANRIHLIPVIRREQEIRGCCQQKRRLRIEAA
jgi:hypothetical protein